MAIEFRCPNCDRKLKTGDDKAGATAKCPQCGTAVTVPAAGTVAAGTDEFEPFPAFGDSDDPVRTGAAGAAPAAGPVPQAACPVCGAQNDAAARRCYACGEEINAAFPGAPGGAPPRSYSA